MLLCRYLHQRLKGFDFDQLFDLHYNLITMGKVPACLQPAPASLQPHSNRVHPVNSHFAHPRQHCMHNQQQQQAEYSK